MSEHPLSFEQIQTVRTAIDLVMGQWEKVARMILPLAGLDGRSASTLANLALEKMELSHRVSNDAGAQGVGAGGRRVSGN